MGITAAIAGGTALIGGAMSADAANDAADTQSDAADRAAKSTWRQFQTTNNQQAPYRNSGYGALSLLNNYMGIAPEQSAPNMDSSMFDSAAYLAANPDVAKKWKGGSAWDHYSMYGKGEGRQFTGNEQYNQMLKQSKEGGPGTPGFGMFTHQFDANDLKSNLAPNYNFMLKQGQNQATNYLNSTGGLVGGNAAQGLNTFTQNYAQNAYQDAFNNYTTNQNNIYSRLSGLAGLGQNSLQQSNAAGAAANASANNFLTSSAAAQAAGKVGAANAWGGALGDAGGYYSLSKLASGGYLKAA